MTWRRSNRKREKVKGFTLLELIIVLALLGLFLTLTIPFGMDFYRENVLQEQTSRLANNLKIAQSHAQSQKDNSSWGIKFEPTDQGCTNCYVMFQGNSYSERNSTYDKVFNITSGVTMEGVIEIVFEKVTGDPQIITN
jgi:prepilin-type N-terminal cleavage/methylation domain-containing protein